MRKLFVILLCCCALTSYAAEKTAAGLWQTFDDKTQLPNGKVEIYEEKGVYYGKIVGSSNPNPKNASYCVNCPGEFKGKPVGGLRFMWGFVRKGDKYSGGHILDPNTGNVYSASMHLVDGGNQLNMRGYLGISLLGSTQKWKRLK